MSTNVLTDIEAKVKTGEVDLATALAVAAKDEPLVAELAEGACMFLAPTKAATVTKAFTFFGQLVTELQKLDTDAEAVTGSGIANLPLDLKLVNDVKAFATDALADLKALGIVK